MLQNNSQRCPSSSVTMTSNNPADIQRKHAQHFIKFNEEIFKRNVLTDVECVVQGQTFKTHRALLVCFSPYLKKKLINAEGKPASKRIHIPKIGSNEFEILLRYMYTGNVEVDCNNFYDVYKAASILVMQDAKLECLQLIDGQDEIRTYFYTYVLSKKLGVQQNWQKALKLITHRFEETVFSKEFIRLNISFVVEILSAQTIGARSETIVFLAALNWLNYDFGRRSAHAVTLMECVRFSSMSMEEIVACYHPPFLPGVVLMSDVTMMLYRATCYVAAKSQGQETWFKQFASPKRNLTLDSLPMKLWHKRSDSSNTEDTYLRSVSISMPLNHDNGAKQWKAESPTFSDLKSSDQATGRNMKNDTEILEANRTPEKPFGGHVKNIWSLENEFVRNERPETVSRLESPGRNGTFYPFQRGKEQEGEKRIPYEVTRRSTDGPREIQYVIPENTKIIHLVKGLSKLSETESKNNSNPNVAEKNAKQTEHYISEMPEKDTSKSKEKKSIINKNTNLIVPKNEISEETAKGKDDYLNAHELVEKVSQDANPETLSRLESPGRNGTFYPFQRGKEQEGEKRIPYEVTRRSADGPREIQYVIPENTKIIHLVKGLSKLSETESKNNSNPNVAEKNAKQTEHYISEMPEKDTSKSKEKKSIINKNTNLIVPKNEISEETATAKGKDYYLNAHELVKKVLQDANVIVANKNVYQSSEQFNSGRQDAMVDGCLLVVGGMNPKSFNKESGGSVMILNLKTNKWINYSSLPEPRHNHCAACLGNYLYVVGGCNPQETIKKNSYVAKRSCFKLNLNTSKWTKLPDMECARFDHAMIIYDAKLFVIGGQDENGRFLKSVEIYNPKHNRWKLLNSKMCCGRKAMGVAVYADRIWIVGGLIQSGIDGQFEAVSHVDCYHPKEKKWVFNMYSLPSPRCFCSLAEWENKLYCIGGMVRTDDGRTQATEEVWFVDVENQLWKQGPSLPAPRMGGTAVIYGKNLYFLGGFDPDNSPDIDVIFLTQGNSTWNSGPPMLSYLFGLSAVAYIVNIGETTK